MRKVLFGCAFILSIGYGLLGGAEDAKPPSGDPYPRISEEGFKARLPFFDYDTKIPLEARIVREWRKDGTVRQKIVLRGAQGFLVPGYIEFPDKAARPCPLLLLLHGWSGSKEIWFDGKKNGANEVHHAALAAGYAVMGLDAATHGERSREIDFQDVNPFEDPQAPPRRNYFTYAEISVQTVKDYRRALDYLAERKDVDMARIGLLGYSMGGMDSFYLLSVEPRIKTAIACVPPLFSPGHGPAAPIDYTWGVRGKALLMLMGRKDDLYEQDKVEASYHQYIEGPATKLIWYDAGHDLKSLYVSDAMQWLKEHL
jgi:dienelactone hydrolase